MEPPADRAHRSPIVGSWKLVAIARIAIAAVMSAYALSYYAGPGRDDPPYLSAFAVTSIGILIALGIVQLRGRLLDAPLCVVGVDVLCILLFAFSHVLDPRRYLFPLTFAPTVEAALVFGFRGAILSWIVISAGFFAREMLSSAVLDTSVQGSTQLVRVGTGFVMTLALGALATAAEERRVSERLRSVDDMKNTFLHAVSHELRTPLASVKGFADILRRHGRDLTPDKVSEIADSISINADKLQRLLADLLDLDRLARNVLQPTLTPTDVGGLVLNVVEQADVTQQVIHVEAPSVVADVDGPKVERIVENMVSNAAKHTPPHTDIRVVVRPRDDGILILVEDEGPGVPDDMKATIFEPFRQGPGEDDFRPPGTGIGLSLVARFAELHGGRAWIEDRPGGGASFRVFLPARVTPASTPAPPGRDDGSGRPLRRRGRRGSGDLASAREQARGAGG